MEFDVFQHEQQLVARARSVLDDGDAQPATVRQAFEELARGYEKLLKTSRRLTRMTDRSQQALKDQKDLLDQMVGEQTRELHQERAKLEKIVELGIALAAEKDHDRLMETLLLGAKDLSNADGGTLYLRQKDDTLKFIIVRNDTLGVALGGTTGKKVPLPPVQLFDAETGLENHRNVVSHAVLLERTVEIPDAYESTEFDFSGTRAFDSRTGYRSRSFLTVPLKPRGAAVIGALQLINAKDPDNGAVLPFSSEIRGFVEALAAQASTILDNKGLVEAQKALLDAFIQLIAGAIDAKSPYTGGHCERVPELAIMIAEAASASDAPPFADFRFTTEDEWREFRIGAWLHDCGKVTTPDHIVDKATKLETIFNRIHEIRMRFEVLLRDARIRLLEARLEGKGDPAALDAEFAAEVARLEADFAFVAECNVGGEFMAPDKIERLKQVAGRTWTRHFDDRLGLSDMEESHLRKIPGAPVPAEEFLLADKPEHIVPRDDGGRPFGDNPNGFDIEVPENLYNRGELHNLSIGRGTLTREDHFKIKEHIIQTISMLEKLPFPTHLARVPEYAGAHHETMIGTGYPRKLTKEQMSLPARIMAVADIFEALTAADRPYKKAKKLSEAIRIMGFMVKDRHLDSDIFSLFLRNDIHQKYADLFLLPEQIDEVDVAPYLNGAS